MDSLFKPIIGCLYAIDKEPFKQSEQEIRDEIKQIMERGETILAQIGHFMPNLSRFDDNDQNKDSPLVDEQSKEMAAYSVEFEKEYKVADIVDKKTRRQKKPRKLSIRGSKIVGKLVECSKCSQMITPTALPYHDDVIHAGIVFSSNILTNKVLNF